MRHSGVLQLHLIWPSRLVLNTRVWVYFHLLPSNLVGNSMTISRTLHLLQVKSWRVMSTSHQVKSEPGRWRITLHWVTVGGLLRWIWDTRWNALGCVMNIFFTVFYGLCNIANSRSCNVSTHHGHCGSVNTCIPTWVTGLGSSTAALHPRDLSPRAQLDLLVHLRLQEENNLRTSCKLTSKADSSRQMRTSDKGLHNAQMHSIHPSFTQVYLHSGPHEHIG